MALAAGERLGPYELLAPVGEGAMGEVWKSRDTRLNRTVALKIAKDQFTDRFEREARAVAALNHPGICTLHDIGPNYLVMEFLEGETLASRLRRGALPLEDAVRYGIQLCDALAAAHARGIVHRDLKPGNIMLSKSSAKVLDFGLAKLLHTDPEAPLAETLTASHALVGTPAYMSPEQVTGGVADARTDIFAFGLVFYEMLAGRRAFDAADSTGLARQILVEQAPPPIPNLAAALSHVLDRCLAKNPSERWQTAHDLKLELEWAAASRLVSGAQPPRRSWLPWAALAAGIAAVALGALLIPRWTQPESATPSYLPFAMEGGRETDPAWSPDGRTIAYAASIRGTSQIVTKTRGAHNAVQITRQAEDCSRPFWSADGRQIYFLSGQAMHVVGAAGGEPRQLSKAVIQTGSISPQGTLAFIRGIGGAMRLWTAHADGSGEQPFHRPPLPDSFARCWTISFSPDGAELALLVEQETNTGFVTDLWIVPFPDGAPRRVKTGLPFRVSSSNPGGSPHRRISWVPGQRRLVVDGEIDGNAGIQLYQIDLDTGNITTITSGVAHARNAAVSPSGDSVAFVSGGDDFDIFQVSVDGSEARPFLSTASREFDPAWAPSARQFAFVSYGSSPGIWIRSVQDEMTIPVLLRGAPGAPPWFSLGQLAFSPRGDRIAFDSVGPKHMIWICPAQGGVPVPLDPESIDQHGASWSPDGNWVAYLRFNKGRFDFVKAPISGGPLVVLAANVGYGAKSAWSPDGAWLAYAAGPRLSLISQDGKTRVLRERTGTPGFEFSRDSSLLYSLHRFEDQAWGLISFDVATGKERFRTKLPLDPAKPVVGLSLHPDGRTFLTSVGDVESDIWILDGLKRSVPALR